MKRLLSVLLVILLIVPTVAVSAEEAKTVSFSDVDSSSAQGQAIIKLATAGVLLGYPDGTFKPEQPITRGELSKVINKIFNYTEADTEVFPDVVKERDWYYNEVAIAKKAGYIKGYDDGTFRGENNMTREEACTILSRVGGLYDLGITYPIKDSVSEWAIPYVNMAIMGGFMSVEEGDTFRATEKITRGEFCQAFEKFVQVKADVELPPVEDDKNKEDNKKEDDKNKEDNKEDIVSGDTTGGDDNYEDETDDGIYDVVDYTEINKDTIEALNTAISELNGYVELFGEENLQEFEKQVVNISLQCIDKVLKKEAEAELTPEYVEILCSSEIESARKVWKAMTPDDMLWFKEITIPEFTFGTLQWLGTFFGIDISEYI